MGERRGDDYSAPLKQGGYVKGRNRIRALEKRIFGGADRERKEGE